MNRPSESTRSANAWPAPCAASSWTAEPEKALLGRLAVFAGGRTLDAGGRSVVGRASILERCSSLYRFKTDVDTVTCGLAG